MPRTRAALCLALFLLSACGAGWHRVEPLPSTTIPARQQVLVYHGTATERWHATTVTSDSITGVHWLTPIECDSCRVALPLTAVDSIVVGDPATGFVKSYLFTVYVLLPAALIGVCVIAHGCPAGD